MRLYPEVPPRGLFASGKFDQYKRDIPYATLAQAFQSLVRTLLGKTEAELRGRRDALLETLGPNGLLIAALVPESPPASISMPSRIIRGRAISCCSLGTGTFVASGLCNRYYRREAP